MPLVVFVALVVVVDLVTGPGGAADQLRSGASTVLGPISRAASATGRAVADAARGFTGASRRETDRLRRENDALRLAARANAEDRRRAAELDALLRTAGLGQYRVVPARVVAIADAAAPQALATLDAGSRDGIRPDQTVLSGAGLVGRVLRVGPTTCDVLLITDPGFSVGVRLEGTGLIGVASGAGKRPMDLRLLDAQTQVDAGTRLVTLGSAGGRPFVPGVPVGEVRTVQTAAGTLARLGSVAPFVRPATVDLVGVVVQPPRQDPRDAVLPPQPTDAPAATPTPAPTSASSGPSPTLSSTPSSAPSAGPSAASPSAVASDRRAASP
ncbi:MAG: rod shape-determining protein MreC [Angustibacter sp.]